MLDFTHDADTPSWVATANAPDIDFPLQNLPFGRFRRAGTKDALRIGVAIGREVLDLHALGQLDPQLAVLLGPLAQGDLNGFMAQGRAARIALRHALFAGLSAQPSGTASLWRAKADTRTAASPRVRISCVWIHTSSAMAIAPRSRLAGESR